MFCAACACVCIIALPTDPVYRQDDTGSMHFDIVVVW